MSETALNFSPTSDSDRPPNGCRRARAAERPLGGSHLQRGVRSVHGYEALPEVDLHLDWIAGISIDTVNGAAIDDDAPQGRVRAVDRFRSHQRQSHVVEHCSIASRMTKASLPLTAQDGREWKGDLVDASS